eukprot:2237986-Prymnesium_polylepis.2
MLWPTLRLGGRHRAALAAAADATPRRNCRRVACTLACGSATERLELGRARDARRCALGRAAARKARRQPCSRPRDRRPSRLLLRLRRPNGTPASHARPRACRRPCTAHCQRFEGSCRPPLTHARDAPPPAGPQENDAFVKESGRLLEYRRSPFCMEDDARNVPPYSQCCSPRKPGDKFFP